MAEPFLAEVRIFSFVFAPKGWALCNGQQLPINQNQGQFSLLGTTYGGDGESTFALPNLQGRVPVHQGNGYILAETGGSESVTLTIQQIPVHNHAVVCSTVQAQNPQPKDSILAQGPTVQAYITDTPAGPISPKSIVPIGGSQPHENMQPYLCVSFIISLFGIFPSPT